MVFTQDWFSNNERNWKRILKDLKDKPGLRFLEIGCFEGKATKWLLENILTNKTSNITVIDTFMGSEEHKSINLKNLEERFKENVKDFKSQVYIRKGFSQDVLRKYYHTKNFKYFDFIYIDGSHTAPDVMSDVILSWPLLKKGGIIIFDDYKWGGWQMPPIKKPKLAIDSFLSIYKGKYKLINAGYQIAIVKTE